MVRVIADKCVGCGLCIRTCVHGAIQMKAKRVTIAARCRSCGVCVDCCPRQALQLEE